MNDKELINNDKKYNENKSLYLVIEFLPIIYTIVLFVLSSIDHRGCNGGLESLSKCMSSHYMFWGCFSIPFSLFSFLGGFSKEPIHSLIVSSLFLIFNVWTFFTMNNNYLVLIVISSILISLITTIISIKLLLKQRKIKQERNTTN